MKELILIISSFSKKCSSLIDNDQFISYINIIEDKGIKLKKIFVNDQITKQLLLKKREYHIPLLYVNNDDEIQKVKGVHNILIFLSHLTKQFDDIPESVTRISRNIFSTSCNNFKDMDTDFFDLIVISDACKISSDNDKVVKVSLKNFDNLIESKNIGTKWLIVSNSKRFVEICLAIFEYFRHKKTYEEIEEEFQVDMNSIIKKKEKQIERSPIDEPIESVKVQKIKTWVDDLKVLKENE